MVDNNLTWNVNVKYWMDLIYFQIDYYFMPT